MIAAVLLALLLGLCSANMNNGGIPYSIGNPSGSGAYKTEFTDPYFDVYSEVRTRYSQVYWTLNDPVDLPADIVSQFKGKVMAITGYEADQVTRTDQGDVSFPIHHAYNHHYFAWLKSTGTEMYQLEKPILSPNPTKWGIRDTEPKTHDFPTNIVFKENPGGEYRKSYHGYPKGYAQLIYSPDQFVLEPMQIDIHNRDYNGTGYPPVWFLPKELANQTDPNSKLSPLIECPCTDRIGRVVQNQSSVLTTGVCTADISSAADCFAAVKNIVPVRTTTTVSSTTVPAGCSVSPDAGGAGTYTAIFNTASQSQAVCGNSETPSTHLKGSTATSLVTLGVEVDVPHARVNVTLVGPSDVWFGVGFHATVMADAPYAIIVDGKGSVTERQLADHGPGSLLTPSITVVSNSVNKGVRTVVVSRPLTGTVYTFPSSPSSIFFIAAVGSTVDLQYHKSHTGGEITLVPTDISSCICAPVSTTYLSYMNSSLMEYNVYCAPEPRSDMAAQHNPACKMQTYMGGTACCHHSWFLTDVEQEPLIPQAEDVYYLKFRFYYQEYVPATQTAPASHQQLHHWVFLIDANVNDYEEVKCADGTLCEGYIEAHLQARDMGIEDIPPTYSGITPLVITAHCHAPSCLRQELFNADTGDLLCKVEAQYGTGSEAFNEEGYVALAPCLFGNEDGLYKPITLSPDTNLTAIKVFNNTYRHLGQMAQWTGLMVYQP